MAFEIKHGDCLEVMRGMADNSVDAIVTDPPYFKVKGEDWDHQWDKPAQFIEWMGELVEKWQRVLKPNGSLYVFASPKMAARVEVKIGERFEVLNHVVWSKYQNANGTGGVKGRHEAQILDKGMARSFFPDTERIIFAEQRGTDELADDASGYTSQCEAAKRATFGDYLRDEIARAGFTNKQIAALFPSATGGITGCVSNWILGMNVPTPQQWVAMRGHLNATGGDYLRREYEDLRREYEDLRREYEDLRRPFTVTSEDQYTDVWTFPTVQAYDGKHVCEKPLALMEHIIRSSTRPDAVVLDCFSGSAATGHACVNLGRSFIGIDKCERWVATGRRRLELASAGVKSRRIGAMVPDATEVKRQLGLFA